MDPVDTWVLGAGGQARETVDLIAAAGSGLDGRALRFLGLVGADDEETLDGQRGALVLGVGWPELRMTLLERFGDSPDFVFPTLVHPLADVGTGGHLADGVVISSGCVVTTDVRLGRGTLLNPRAGIGHDTTVGRGCVLNPGVNVSGAVEIGDAVLVGSGATVLQGVRLGDRCVIGAGAVVTRDVAPDTTVIGVPARVLERRTDR